MITRPKPPGIYGFHGIHRYLSNFYIEYDGSHVEGEYQRAKCRGSGDRARFHQDGKILGGPLKSPAECRVIGKKVQLRTDWEEVKLGIMLFYVTKKFKDDTLLRNSLLLSKPLYLEETNDWGDDFWGVCNEKGQNMLGAILMQVREEL